MNFKENPKEAVSEIKPGSTLIFSGFQLSRAPIALVQAIIDQKISDLSIVSLPNPLPLDMLCKEGLVSKALFGFNGFSYEYGFQIIIHWKESIKTGAIQYEETDVAAIIGALKAGIDGEDVVEIDWIRGSDYVKVNGYEERDGKIVTPAIKPDYALIHAQRCDEDGNIQIIDPLTDELVWKSAKKVIVSVEEKVDRIENPTIPAKQINSIVVAPDGAKPTAVFGFYTQQSDHIASYFDVQEKPKKGLSNEEKNSTDQLICTLARQILPGETVLTGVASVIPMLASLLAKNLNEDITYINCSGAINPRPKKIYYSSANTAFLENCDKYITLPEIFESNIDVMFMGARQIDPQGNINLTCLGDYNDGGGKLAGPAAIIYLRKKIKKSIIFVPSHSDKIFVPQVDFVTSPYQEGTIVVTPLGMLKLGAKSEIIGYHKHSSLDEMRSLTGFDLAVSNKMTAISLPTKKELDTLRKIDPTETRYNL